jgi:hypothetical protein
MYIWSLSPLDQSFMMISLKLAVDSVQRVQQKEGVMVSSWE